MILIQPTKITMKMEDDLVEYEELKTKLREEKRAQKMQHLSPGAYVTPNSAKMQFMEERDAFQQFVTPENNRVPGLPLNDPDNRNLQYDYINILLSSVAQEDNDDEIV